MYKLIFNNLIILLLAAGCVYYGEESFRKDIIATIHQKINDPEKVKQIETMINKMSIYELIELVEDLLDSEKRMSTEHQ